MTNNTLQNPIAAAIKLEHANRRAIKDTLAMLEQHDGKTFGRINWEPLKEESERIYARWQSATGETREQGCSDTFPVSPSDYRQVRHTGTAVVRLQPLRDKLTASERCIENLDTLDTLPEVEDAIAARRELSRIIAESRAKFQAERDRLIEAAKAHGVDMESIRRHTYPILTG